MNERIRELADQCRIETYGVNGELLEFGFNEEKFAELIVRECMKVVINGKYSSTECERNTHRIAHNNARDEASSDIKKHFGVES
jgi:hypothetical protein